MKKNLIMNSVTLTFALSFTACSMMASEGDAIQAYDPTSVQSTKIKRGMPPPPQVDASRTQQVQNYSPVILPPQTPVLTHENSLKISVVGQGVAPCNGSCSPAQAYAMAKRAAIADAYRLIAEKVKGVYVEGDDFIKNMMVQRSTVKTSVQAMIRNANVVETTFKDGLCEVEMDIVLTRSQIFR